MTTVLEALRAGIAAEWRRRAAEQIEASPEEHAEAFASVVLSVLLDAGWAPPARDGKSGVASENA